MGAPTPSRSSSSSAHSRIFQLELKPPPLPPGSPAASPQASAAPPVLLTQKHSTSMKFSIVAAAAVAIACVFQPVAAESEASIHLRVHAEKGNCYTAHCGSGQYCAWSQGWCRAPNRSKNECFNPATGEFQTGCSAGFACKNGKCDYA